jgi:hypothetical protein
MEIDEEIDIIPHVNILVRISINQKIHGGDEYDFITAMAELIDNSIQNTIQNQNSRNIEITFLVPSKKNSLVKNFIKKENSSTHHSR